MENIVISEALERIIANAKEITEELSYLCMKDDKRSQHIAEKFHFQYAKTFYHVKKSESDAPRDFRYYILPL